MKKYLVQYLCCLIPFKELRKKIRQSYAEKEKYENKNLLKEIESLKFQLNLFLTHFVDMNNAKPATALMRQLQLKRAEGLNYVATILEKNNIDYWLDGGTLLGAIRHKGFIPWDDDIDIGFFEADKSRLIEVLNKELENHPTYKFIDFGEYANWPKDCLFKLVDKETYECFVDILSFDNSYKYKDAIYKVWWHKSQLKKTYASRKPELHFSKDTLLPLGEIEFEKRIYKAPNNPIKYAELQYGNINHFPSSAEHGAEWIMKQRLQENLIEKEENL